MKKTICFFFSALIASSMLCALVSCDSNDSLENPFRELLSTLDWGSDTCYVYGHKTPDSDAVCSSLAYAQLMRELGYKSAAKISSKANNETKYISGLFGFNIPSLKPSVAPGTRLIATDHEEYEQSVDGARDARILQIVDHHQLGNMYSPGVVIYRQEIGSTCTLVWQLYRLADVPVDDLTAKVMLAGLMSDTRNLAKDNTTKEDSLVWNALTTQLHFSSEYVADVYSAMEEALTSYDGMTDYEIFVSDYKDYDMSGTAVGIGCVEWKDYETMDDLIDRMLAVMPQAQADLKRDMVFCMATKYAPDPDAGGKVIPTGTYLLYQGEGTRELVGKAFGPSIRDGVYYSETRLGRKGDVVPKLAEMLKRD